MIAIFTSGKAMQNSGLKILIIMLFKLLILSAILLILSFAGFAVRILLKKNGKFQSTHISENEEMKKRGILCAQQNDVGCNPTNEFGCSTCGVKRL